MTSLVCWCYFILKCISSLSENVGVEIEIRRLQIKEGLYDFYFYGHFIHFDEVLNLKCDFARVQHEVIDGPV